MVDWRSGVAKNAHQRMESAQKKMWCAVKRERPPAPERRETVRTSCEMRRSEPPKCLMISCAILVLLGLCALISTNISVGASFRTAEPVKPAYCNLAAASGAEGRGARAMELVGVVIMVRHGDRSAIHTELNGTGASGAGPALRCDAREEIDRLNAAFTVWSLSSRLPLGPLGSLRGERGFCAVGQLTPRGIAQHAALGRHLGYAYQRFLSNLAPPSSSLTPPYNLSGSPTAAADVSVAHPSAPYRFRSTNYDRTLLSAASLLHSMLPPALLPSAAGGDPRRRVPIWTHEDESRDELHGVGLTSSTAQLPSGGERMRAGQCTAAAAAARRQMARWVEDMAAWGELKQCNRGARLPEPTERVITHVSDPLYAYSCHGVPLPGCISPRLTRRFWEESDRWYCARYGGARGGVHASRLSMRPLLQAVIRDLGGAAAGSGPRLVLYSGHDTVLAPILAAISAGGAGVPCGWPPYASRLVWEVWARKGGGGGGKAATGVAGMSSPGGLLNGRDPGMLPGVGGSAGAAVGPELFNSSGQESGGQVQQNDAYLRVLYNGKVITPHIVGCHGRRQRKGGDDADLARGAGEMCPLRSFERALRRSMDSLSCTDEAAA